MNCQLLPKYSIATFLAAGVLLSGTKNAAAYIDCTCKNVGSSICIPDPHCSQESAAIVYDAGKEIERILRDAADISEKVPQESSKTLEKAIQDAGKVLEKAAKDTQTPSLRILASGYSLLTERGKEEPGYGLYSYIVLLDGGDRSAALLGEVFKSIPAIDDTEAERSRLNIIYIPIKKEAVGAFAESAKELQGNPKQLGVTFLGASSHDLRMARAILNQLCNPPADAIRELCLGDMSRGPYIFT